MSTELEEAKERYCAEFERFEPDAVKNGGSWLGALRQAAISRFAALGFPTVKDEEWKYTPVAPIAKGRFKRAGAGPADLAPNGIAEYFSRERFKHQLVFVNGRFSERLSSVAPTPGLTVARLAEAVAHDRARVEPYLGRSADFQNRSFVALNTAFMEDGAFVRVAEGRVIDETIHLLFVSVSDGAPPVSYPRNLIVAEDGSQVKILESYVGLGSRAYWTNAVSEVVLHEGAVVEHYKLERESTGAFHVATLEARLGRNGNFTSRSIGIGGAWVRNDVNAALAGEGGECALDGLYLGSGARHVDNHTKIDHMKPHCASRELYKGILDERSTAVFNGKIVVWQDAQKSDAKQTNKNLLLSEEATVDTKPQLEIFNNDVKCTHASTIGRLDENALFYLRSRGLGLPAARALLTYAFASEIVDRVSVAPVRAELDKLLMMRFEKEVKGGQAQ